MVSTLVLPSSIFGLEIHFVNPVSSNTDLGYHFVFAVTDENTYILTTDADVKFTHESVEALLDLMARDPTVGAVCARTHPLGVGPLVWYQIFDYAIGHWFQKVRI